MPGSAGFAAHNTLRGPVFRIHPTWRFLVSRRGCRSSTALLPMENDEAFSQTGVCVHSDSSQPTPLFFPSVARRTRAVCPLAHIPWFAISLLRALRRPGCGFVGRASPCSPPAPLPLGKRLIVLVAADRIRISVDLQLQIRCPSQQCGISLVRKINRAARRRPVSSSWKLVAHFSLPPPARPLPAWGCLLGHRLPYQARPAE